MHIIVHIQFTAVADAVSFEVVRDNNTVLSQCELKPFNRIDFIKLLAVFHRHPVCDICRSGPAAPLSTFRQQSKSREI